MRFRYNLLAGGIATLGASLCCVGPLVLVMLGISGSWIANMTRLETIRPAFLALSLYFIYRAWRSIYRPAACASDRPCSSGSHARWQRWVFWLAILPLLAILTFPWYAPLFY